MAVRGVHGQLWIRTPQASDEEHPPNTDYEDYSSELSELDSGTSSEDDGYTPDTEVYDEEDDKYDDEEYHDFEKRDRVWVKPRGTSTWYQGVITRIQQPTEPAQWRRGPLYLVVFRRYHTNLRAWFSPVEGNMKPDTPRVRAMVQGSS
ncbi:hypothetical protein BV20DRAFT_995950 [Pilatotrama ljubarskyi]|nr:hypothetical protein BV20DRAFT_995950 [Pilatotrama ljubarskyi]